MKLIIDIPDNELKNPLKNIHLLINNGIITEVCIKKYDKDEPYFMDLNYAPLEECDDCISRQAVLAEMYKRKENGDAVTAGFIKNLPSVIPAEKVGHWIYEKRKRLINETDEGAEYITDYWCKCSRCGGDFGYRKMKDAFCKYCGAKMEVEE